MFVPEEGTLKQNPNSNQTRHHNARQELETETQTNLFKRFPFTLIFVACFIWLLYHTYKFIICRWSMIKPVENALAIVFTFEHFPAAICFMNFGFQTTTIKRKCRPSEMAAQRKREGMPAKNPLSF